MNLKFTVPGRPQPAGSKRGFPLRLPGGKVRVIITDANLEAKPWQAEVRYAALVAYRGEAWSGPLRLTLRFFLTRPKGHFGKKGVRASAPKHPTVKPDALKLARAVEDACTGILWLDDAQIVEEHLSKEYGPQDGCVVEVEEIKSGLAALLEEEAS